MVFDCVCVCLFGGVRTPLRVGVCERESVCVCLLMFSVLFFENATLHGLVVVVCGCGWLFVCVPVCM